MQIILSLHHIFRGKIFLFQFVYMMEVFKNLPFLKLLGISDENGPLNTKNDLCTNNLVLILQISNSRNSSFETICHHPRKHLLAFTNRQV